MFSQVLLKKNALYKELQSTDNIRQICCCSYLLIFIGQSYFRYKKKIFFDFVVVLIKLVV